MGGCSGLFILFCLCSVIGFFSPPLGIIAFVIGVIWGLVSDHQYKRNAEERERQSKEDSFRRDMLAIESGRFALEQERLAREQESRLYTAPPEQYQQQHQPHPAPPVSHQPAPAQYQPASVARREEPQRPTPKPTYPKVAPDAPCPCGSGKPYKRCHRNQ
jgi:uncharacterized membrane protein